MPAPKWFIQKKASPKKAESSSLLLPLMKQEPMEVYGRIRRLQNIDDILVVQKTDEQHLEVISPPPLPGYRFKFQKVFDHSCSQQEVFDSVAAPLVKDLLHAKNGLIFTYGSSGSGKTHTIVGHPEDPGILPRAIDMIFNTLQPNNLQCVPYIFKANSRNSFEIVPPPDAVQQLQDNLNYCQIKSSVPKMDEASEWKNRVKENSFVKDVNCDYSYGVFVSFIRIYSDCIDDLLNADQARTNGTDGPCSCGIKKIKEDAKKQSYVHGAKQMEVRGADDAIELFIRGMKLDGKTGINSKSEEASRSHLIFTVRIVRSPLDLEGVLPIDNKKLIQIGQLSIVDLAGCERETSIETSNGRLKEAKKNHSLLALEKCLNMLRENQKSDRTKKLIPYEASHLTHLFKSFFDGDGRVRMVVCLDPRFKDYHTTVHALKFAEKSQELTTNRTLRANFLGGMLAMHTKFESSVFYAPIIPPIQCSAMVLNDLEDDEHLPKIMEYVEQKREEFETFDTANQMRQIEIRDAILEMEQELASLKDELENLKKDNESKRTQLCDYETQFNDMQQKIATIENNKRKLLLEINGLKQRLKIEKQARVQSENQFKSLRAKLGKVLENEATHLRKKLIDAFDANIVSNQNNLDREKYSQILQNILSADNFPCPESVRKFLSSSDSIAPGFDAKHVSFNDHVVTESSKPKITDKNHVKKKSKEMNVLNVPIINPRFGQSSNDSQEKWINHLPLSTYQMGTIMRPILKNSKSVTQLKTTDLINNRKKIPSKYALTHHETSSSGLVETKIFKGDVIPTLGGGVQIIFNDVEMLKQKSPAE